MIREELQCRHSFIPRPAPPDLCHAGPGDEAHLKPHVQSPAFKKHKLVKVKASSLLQENICPRHGEDRKLFCHTDQQRICYMCSVQEHKGHNIVLAERKKEQNIKQRIQEREKDSVNDFLSEVRGMIKGQQEREGSRAEELRRRVEQELAELEEKRRQDELEDKRRQAELEKALHTKEPSKPSPPKISEPAPPVKVVKVVSPPKISEPAPPVKVVKVVVTKKKYKLKDVPAEPKTREDFLQYSSCPVTLDPNTAHQHLCLSKENRKVTWMEEPQSHPDHPERFTDQWQVLSTEALPGRRYWEVEWSGRAFTIAVSYKNKKKNAVIQSAFGSNDKSWSLRCVLDKEKGYYVFSHGGRHNRIPGPVSFRVGVYLDHSAGTLSFYALEFQRSCRFHGGIYTMTLLHTVHTTFGPPLYAGFRVWCVGDAGELCDLK